ncbi:MAG TPA: tRNA (adenosine(37)-N6)-threonylcarbamoyltransferase complex dimerization subunit type 1 TsaB [Candidatus Saccharimonadales bacterium]|nr:tRNA (adenosine(37)-N6)-threonylcarbamoyltransferase complex dimerization subunit type 1 TsaB [Candidatus Saccharimonadales bacterium]
MILTIKTDSPTAELTIFSNGKRTDEYIWEANRELARDLLKKIQELLRKNNADFNDLTGLVVYSGPGSFTGLRIGLTVANTIAYGQNIPIVGSTGDDWLQDGLQKIASGQNDKVSMPYYGAEANITAPKK